MIPTWLAALMVGAVVLVALKGLAVLVCLIARGWDRFGR